MSTPGSFTPLKGGDGRCDYCPSARKVYEFSMASHDGGGFVAICGRCMASMIEQDGKCTMCREVRDGKYDDKYELSLNARDVSEGGPICRDCHSRLFRNHEHHRGES